MSLLLQVIGPQKQRAHKPAELYRVLVMRMNIRTGKLIWMSGTQLQPIDTTACISLRGHPGLPLPMKYKGLTQPVSVAWGFMHPLTAPCRSQQ